MSKKITIILVAMLVGTSMAQTNNSTRKEVVKVKQELSRRSPDKFSMKMIEGDRINPGFLGPSILDVVNSVEKLTNHTKGEFESTTEFNARRATILAEKFLGDFSLNDTFAFVVDVRRGRSNSGGISYDFNADTGELRLFVVAKKSSMNGIGAPISVSASSHGYGFDKFDLNEIIDSTEIYQASNAYGASLAVKLIKSTRVGLAVDEISFLSYSREDFYLNPESSILMRIGTSKAAKELPTLKALIAMRVHEPYIRYSYLRSEPTRGSPIDIKIQEKHLAGEVLGIIFFSGITGEILARLPEGFGGKTANVESKSVNQ